MSCKNAISFVSSPCFPAVLLLCCVVAWPAVIRKDLILVDGVVGSCKTEVTAGRTLQQLEAVAKGKGPRTVSLQV
jgi:hypothetical protein